VISTPYSKPTGKYPVMKKLQRIKKDNKSI
jgi:hypothetical protein